jgi:hypothetical protein
MPTPHVVPSFSSDVTCTTRLGLAGALDELALLAGDESAPVDELLPVLVRVVVPCPPLVDVHAARTDVSVIRAATAAARRVLTRQR